MASKKAAAKRKDFGAPIESKIDKQPAPIRAICVQLREMIEAAAPNAQASLKWGMPFFTLEGGMMCAIGIHKAHVNLILSGPPGTFADPKGLLEGEGKTGRHLKLTSAADIPRTDVKKWLSAAASAARGKTRTSPRAKARASRKRG